jgi:hypothetical protein
MLIHPAQHSTHSSSRSSTLKSLGIRSGLNILILINAIVTNMVAFSLVYDDLINLRDDIRQTMLAVVEQINSGQYSTLDQLNAVGQSCPKWVELIIEHARRVGSSFQGQVPPLDYHSNRDTVLQDLKRFRPTVYGNLVGVKLTRAIIDAIVELLSPQCVILTATSKLDKSIREYPTTASARHQSMNLIMARDVFSDVYLGLITLRNEMVDILLAFEQRLNSEEPVDLNTFGHSVEEWVIVTSIHGQSVGCRMNREVRMLSFNVNNVEILEDLARLKTRIYGNIVGVRLTYAVIDALLEILQTTPNYPKAINDLLLSVEEYETVEKAQEASTGIITHNPNPGLHGKCRIS